jgi:lipopolysaccharide export system protein LptA
MIRLILPILVLMSTPVLAAEPIKVSADNFVIDEATSTATFTGNVVVTSEGLELTATKVVVRYGGGGVEDIRSFDATGNVNIETEGQTASGSRAVYDPTTQVLTMTGDVEVKNEAGTVTSSELTVNLRTNTTKFEGGGGNRVTGVFTPQ